MGALAGLGPFILGAAGIQGATSLAGGKKGASAATSAAQIQAQAAQQSLALQAEIRKENVGELQPFVDIGRAEIPSLAKLADAWSGAGAVPTDLPKFTFQPTMADLEKTPGYQFTLQQGLNAEQAKLASMGLGSSGSAVRGAGQFASGLAAQTWPQVFAAQLQEYQQNVQSTLASRQQELGQRQQIYNQYAGLVGTGLSAAGALAGSNIQSGAAQSQAITQAGAAQASGVVGAANALTAGLTGVGNAAGSAIGNYTQLAIAQALLQKGGLG